MNRRLSTTLLAMGVALCPITACTGAGGTTGPDPAPSGTLTVSSCEIPSGASTCAGTVTWTTTGATAPLVLFGSTTLSQEPSGSSVVQLNASSQTIALINGARRLDEKSIAGICVAASSWDGITCRKFAIRAIERAPTPFVEAGKAVTLEVVIYRPLGAPPFPAVMFHHGSTGSGDDPAQFRLTYASERVAKLFTERGWLVMFPQRRGRGASDGLYDEGFTPDRSRYSCLSESALAGFDRALLDADAAADFLATHGDVDPSRLLVAGTSRGGILAIAHAARRAEIFDGVVNFVGGWLGEGCQDAVAVNREGFVRGARFPRPTLWLYASGDTFYSLAHSRGNFDAFVSAGGRGRFAIFSREPTLNGHFLVNDPELWSDELDAYLGQVDP